MFLPLIFVELPNVSAKSQENMILYYRYVSTPYIRGTSERVSKILRKYDIVLSNKPSNTLFNQFNNLKDPLPNNNKTNVVYQLSCVNC